MSGVGLVPWRNAEQFLKVYECLFSNKVEKKKWAYDTISIWEANCHPSLPTAIEATFVLTSAVIQDILWTNEASLLHHIDIQGIYGSAITRFVSLSVEVNKNKNMPTYSISEVAKLIGIPSFIVELRNELCHSARPSISVLRVAAQSALNYLKASYWEKEAACIRNRVKEPLDGTGIRNIFQQYIQFHYDVLLRKKERFFKHVDQKPELNPEYNFLLQLLDKSFRRNKELFIRVFVSYGIFIPTDEDFKNQVSKEEYQLFSLDYNLDCGDMDEKMEDDSNKSIALFELKNLPEIPRYHESLWEQIILLLNKYDAVPMFMTNLLKTQGNRTLIGQKLLIAWILKLLNLSYPLQTATQNCLLKKALRRKTYVPNWFNMLYSAVTNPCKYTLTILPLIFEKLKLQKEATHAIVGVTALKLGLAEVKQNIKFVRLFHTVNDLKKDLAFQREKDNPEQKTESIGVPCPDDCNKLWPVGNIVNMIKEKDDDDADAEYDVKMEIKQEKTEFYEDSPTDIKIEEDDDDDDEEFDDDDQTYIMDDEPNLSKILSEIDKRDSLLYKR